MELTSQSLKGAEEILKITNEMKEHIKQEDVNSLNKAIDLRQEAMDQVSSINNTVKEKMEELLSLYSIDSFEDIDKEKYPQIDSILDGKKKAKSIYVKVYDLEKINCESVEDLLKEYKGAIKNLHTNK